MLYTLYIYIFIEDEEEKGDDDDNVDNNDDDHKQGDDDKPALRERILSCNNKLTAADIVFKEALKYLKTKALEYIDATLGIQGINVDDIQWILTIPSIWNHGAKYMMRKWGRESGLINPEITNHLKIVLEPECASLQIQYEFRDHKDVQFKPGDKYILVDAGGIFFLFICINI